MKAIFDKNKHDNKNAVQDTAYYLISCKMSKHQQSNSAQLKNPKLTVDCILYCIDMAMYTN